MNQKRRAKRNAFMKRMCRGGWTKLAARNFYYRLAGHAKVRIQTYRFFWENNALNTPKRDPVSVVA